MKYSMVHLPIAYCTCLPSLQIFFARFWWTGAWPENQDGAATPHDRI